MATPQVPSTDRLDAARRSLRRWRRARPFWGGLFLILAALELFLSANLDLAEMQLHLGPQGFLAYVLPSMLLLSGLLAWATPATRHFYGVIGLITATYSLVGLNFGGFLLGLLLGIVGGALVIAWSPRPRTAADSAVSISDDAAPGNTTPANPAPSNPAPSNPAPRYPAHADPEATAILIFPFSASTDVPPAPAEAVERTDTAAPQTTAPQTTVPQPRAAQPRSPQPNDLTQEMPVVGRDETRDPSRGGISPPLLAITLILSMVAVTGTIAAGHTAVTAAPSMDLSMLAAPAPDDTKCPTALKNLTAGKDAELDNTEKARSRAAAHPAPHVQDGAPKPAADPNAAGAPKVAAAPKPATAAQPEVAANAAASTPPEGATGPDTDADKDANPLVEGWNDFVGGVKRLFTGDPGTSAADPESNPSADPSASTVPSSPAPSSSAGPDVVPVPGPADSPAPTTPPASPPADPDEVPCLGDRIRKSIPEDTTLPAVALRGGILTGTKLVMTKPVYRGVTRLRTSTGAVRALRFDMQKAVTTQFKLVIPEAGGRTTAIASSELTTESKTDSDDGVHFFATKFTGKLFGIPLTFTPDLPPPFIPDRLPFTDVVIELTFVRCDTLKGENLSIGLN